MNDYYPYISIILLIAVIILWVCARLIAKTWRSNRQNEHQFSSKLENILNQAIRAQQEAQQDEPPTDDPPGASPVPDDKPKSPLLSGSAAKKFPPEDE